MIQDNVTRWKALASEYYASEQKFLGAFTDREGNPVPACYTDDALRAKAAASMLSDVQERLGLNRDFQSNDLLNAAKSLLFDIVSNGNLRKEASA